MDKHITQGKYNHSFHNSICTDYPEHYFDWKVVCLFYTALHYMRAYIISKGQNAGTSHREIETMIKPNQQTRAILEVSKTCWDNYRNLYLYSRTARYEGFIDLEGFDNDRKNDHIYSEQHLKDIILYLEGRGIAINAARAVDKKQSKQ